MKAERLQFLLKVGILTLFLFSLTLIYFLTLSYDEAWLMSEYREIFEGKNFEYKMITQSMTNGGVFVLIGAFIYSLFGIHIWLFRLVSYSSLLMISCILWRWSKNRWSDTTASLIVLSVFLGAWGTVELGAMAYGCVVAMLLFLVSLHFMLNAEDSSSRLRRYILCGIFVGFASSSRLNFLAIFPAIILEALLPYGNRRKKLIDALCISVIGAASFLFSLLLVIYFSPESSKALIERSVTNTGLENLWLDYPRILNKWIVANGFLPIYIMAGLTGYAFWDDSKYSRIMRILVVFGWLHWFAWLIRAPIAHLRYFWPTIASFAVVGGFGLAFFYVWAKRNSRSSLSLVALAVSSAFVAHGLANGFRSLIHGEANILSWEWSRETPLSNYRWLRYKRQQNQMVEYLIAHQSKGEEIGVIGIDLELETLSGIKVVPLSYYFEGDGWKKKSLPKKLLISPMIGHYLYLKPSLFQWMEENLQKEVQYGRYILYRVSGSYPSKSDIFHYTHSPYPELPYSSSFFRDGRLNVGLKSREKAPARQIAQ